MRVLIQGALSDRYSSQAAQDRDTNVMPSCEAFLAVCHTQLVPGEILTYCSGLSTVDRFIHAEAYQMQQRSPVPKIETKTCFTFIPKALDMEYLKEKTKEDGQARTVTQITTD